MVLDRNVLMDVIEQNAYTWKVHPARQRWVAAMVALVVIVCAGWLIATWVDSPSWAPWVGLGAVVILILSLNRFFFPSTFTIDQRGITAVFPMTRKRYQWRQLRRFVHDDAGGFLSTRSRRSRFDAFSGLHLVFPNKREPIVSMIKSYMQEQPA